MRTLFHSIKCCAASSIVMKGIQGLGKPDLSFTPGKLPETGELKRLQQKGYKILLQTATPRDFGDYLEFLLHLKTCFVRN